MTDRLAPRTRRRSPSGSWTNTSLSRKRISRSITTISWTGSARPGTTSSGSTPPDAASGGSARSYSLVITGAPCWTGWRRTRWPTCASGSRGRSSPTRTTLSFEGAYLDRTWLTSWILVKRSSSWDGFGRARWCPRCCERC